MSRDVLLLTATITPPAGMPTLVITDVESRRRDYERTLAFYTGLIGRCFDRIVFCENSLSDLDSLRAVAAEAGHAERVEFVSFNGVDHPPEFGRAYGEFRLIDHAMEHARALAEAAEDQVVWKCTGRYLIRNMAKLVRDRPRRFDLYCNKRNVPIPWCDMYFLAWNRAGYEVALRGIAPQVKEGPEAGGEAPESRFRRIIDACGDRLALTPRFRHVPLIDARRGWDNTPYGASRWNRKILMREAALRLAPWLWI